MDRLKYRLMEKQDRQAPEGITLSPANIVWWGIKMKVPQRTPETNLVEHVIINISVNDIETTVF